MSALLQLAAIQRMCLTVRCGSLCVAQHSDPKETIGLIFLMAAYEHNAVIALRFIRAINLLVLLLLIVYFSTIVSIQMQYCGFDGFRYS